MATTTKLYARTKLDHAHIVAIFLAKECHSAHGLRLIDWGMTALLEHEVLTDDLVGQYLSFAQLLRGHLLEVREVKAQAVGIHEATLLLYVLAQYLAECVVDDVCSRVVACDGLTTLCVHGSYECALDVLRQFG